MRIWQRAGQFGGYRGRPKAWLLSIAGYEAIDRLRSRRPLIAIDAAIEARLDDAQALEVIDAAASGRMHLALEPCWWTLPGRWRFAVAASLALAVAGLDQPPPARA